MPLKLILANVSLVNLTLGAASQGTLVLEGAAAAAPWDASGAQLFSASPYLPPKIRPKEQADAIFSPDLEAW